MEHDIIYHEKFAAKGFILIFSPITAVMLLLLFYHLLTEPIEPFMTWTFFFLAMLLFFLILTVGFSTFSITLTCESVSIGFGIKKHKIQLAQIIDVQPDDVSAAKYGGFGIKVTRIKGKNRLVYNTIGTPRIVLTLKEGRFPEFVFSTKSPDEVINVIRAQVSLIK